MSKSDNFGKLQFESSNHTHTNRSTSMSNSSKKSGSAASRVYLGKKNSNVATLIGFLITLKRVGGLFEMDIEPSDIKCIEYFNPM